VSGQQSAGPGGIERRRAPRFGPEELAEPVLVIGSHLVNIGPGGLMMEAPIPLAPESRIHLRLVVGGERADVEARVAACVPRGRGTGRCWGVGVEFTSMPGQARERLAHALAGPRSRPS